MVGTQTWPQETASPSPSDTNVAMLTMDYAADDEEVGS